MSFLWRLGGIGLTDVLFLPRVLFSRRKNEDKLEVCFVFAAVVDASVLCLRTGLGLGLGLGLVWNNRVFGFTFALLLTAILSK